MKILSTLVNFTSYLLKEKYPELEVLVNNTDFDIKNFKNPLIFVSISPSINLGKSEKWQRAFIENEEKVKIIYSTMYRATLILDAHSKVSNDYISYSLLADFQNLIKTQKAREFLYTSPEYTKFSIKEGTSIDDLSFVSGANHIARHQARFNVTYHETIEEIVKGYNADELFRKTKIYPQE